MGDEILNIYFDTYIKFYQLIFISTVMKSSTLIALLLLLSAVTPALSQLKAKADNGREVILKSDGTWTYLDGNASTSAGASFDYSCDNVGKAENDRVTGGIYGTTKVPFTINDENGNVKMKVSVVRMGNGLDITFDAPSAGCIKKNEPSYILFKDGSNNKQVNNADYNCDGKFRIYLGDGAYASTNYKRFTKKKLDTIRIIGEGGIVEHNFNEHESKLLQSIVQCLGKDLVGRWPGDKE